MNKKISLYIIFSLLLLLGTYFFFAFYNKNYSKSKISNMNTVPVQKTTPLPFMQILVMSDSHQNYDNFPTIKNFLNSNKIDFLVHLGDLTDFGDLESLAESNKSLNYLEITSFVLPGDHDIAQTSSESNFSKIFPLLDTFSTKNIKFTFIRNEYNFTPFSNDSFIKILGDIKNADVVFTSQPIFTDKKNMFSDRYMGSLENIDQVSESNKTLLKTYNQQRNEILQEIRKTSKPILIVSGDHHLSSTYTDPVNNLVTYHITGALAKYISVGSRMVSQKSLQPQEFSIIKVYKNNATYDFKVEEVIIENLIKSDINK